MKHLSHIAKKYGQFSLFIIIFFISILIISYFRCFSNNKTLKILSYISCIFLILCSFFPETTSIMVRIHTVFALFGILVLIICEFIIFKNKGKNILLILIILQLISFILWIKEYNGIYEWIGIFLIILFAIINIYCKN